jgi:DNA-binding response OmpR family regulator
MAKNILIVEDDPVLRRVFEELLVDEGFTARSVCEIDDALAVIHDFDLVLLDMKLGERSGGEILDVLARAEQGPAVLAISATPRLARIARDYNLPFIAKPFAIEAVLAGLTEARRPSRPATSTARRRAFSLIEMPKL